MATEREVLYRLVVQPGEQNARILAKHVADIKKLREDLAKLAKKGGEDEADAAEKAAEKERKAQEKLLAQKQRERDREAAAAARARQKEERESQQHVERLTRQWENAQGRIKAGRAQMTEGFLGGLESLTRMGRGFAALGLVGEDSLAKLRDGLLRITGVTDLIIGGVKTFQNLSRAVEAFQAVSQAQAQAEQVARARTLALLRAEIAAENTLAGARLRSGAAALSSAAARGGGSLVGGGAGLAGGGAAAAGSAVGGPLAIAAVVALVVAALASLAERITGAGTVMEDFNKGLDDVVHSGIHSILGFFSDETLKGLMTQGGSIANATIGEVLSDRRVERMMASNRQANARAARQDLRADVLATGQFESRYASERQTDFGIGLAGSARDRAAAIGQAEANTAQDAYRTDVATHGANTATQQRALFEEQQRLAERQVTLLQQRLAAERQVISEERQVISERIRASETELSNTRTRIQAERERLLSAAERFGNLDPIRQAQAIAAQRQAQSRGAGSLSRDQRELLRGIGTRQAGDFARQGALAEARRAGFFDTFGGEERDRIAADSSRARKLEVSIQDQRKLQVQLDIDEQTLAEETAGYIADKVQESLGRLESRIQKEVERKLVEVSQLNEEQVLQRRALAQSGR